MDPPISRIDWNDDKIMQTRIELDKTKQIMKENVQKIMERQEKLDDLVDRAQRLEASSEEYVKCAAKIERKVNWETIVIRYAVFGITATFAIGGIAWAFV